MEQHESLLSRLANAYIWLQKLADPLVIAVENMPQRHGLTQPAVTSTTDFLELLDRVPTMKFTLDIGHALQNGDDYYSFLKSYPETIANIHLHDGRRGGSAHLALGRGDLDIRGLFSALSEVHYRDYVSLETIGLTDTQLSWSIIQEYGQV